ncbi:hypothetical protein BC939DRAFT_508444 [Gamsiella multidivaricata]|uniref:uncharacterized protein n=1 Tax=Gamsiella multidivaricata TaxID=101098 RepID=UPI00221E52B2|nr:uncharacterized protein BC939DRAFT_508444 [Gamsiella multidivaricata]KAG0354151.1 hypothetical protein BGZ54_001806 [Gamsiella multidivaricata]KAI7816273.1 hypothetical protein BC939DRAFT_508444 [Gamsiella multidivaricata]
MGTHHNLDSFTNLHLPPTFLSSSQPAPTSSTPAHTPSYINSITERVKTDIVKQENGKPPPKPRKKRGMYKKTILRKQAEAAAAAAAGLPLPQPSPATSDNQQTASSAAVSAAKGKARAEQPPTTSTVENPDVRSRKHGREHAASPTTLEMERELAMLAEEAEEDRRRREEEAADRILKRAQVVKHLRSLKSKLATAQIQIGQDLHYQSIDLFSQLYDEVLEDIGRDNNSELLNLLKSSAQEQTENQDSDLEDSAAVDHPVHMPTRSSDRSKKRDTENDTSTHRSIRRGKRSSQYIGQSWDIGSGLDGFGLDGRKTTSGSSNYRCHLQSSNPVIHLDLEDDNDNDEGFDAHNLRKKQEKKEEQLEALPQAREELQLRQRQELEELQLKQRMEQEEFQRRQLEQIRELQTRQNEDSKRFETACARLHRERLEELIERKQRISQSRARHKESYSSTSQSYEFDNGFQSPSAGRSPSHSRSPSPAPPQHHSPRQSHERHSSLIYATSSADQIMSSKNTSLSSDPTQPTPKSHKVDEIINPLPMSTMTLALTSMNEKKKQLKRALKKQMAQEDMYDKDAEKHDITDQQETGPGRRLLSPPIWSQKRHAAEDTTRIKRSASVVSSSMSPTPQRAQRHTPDHRSHLDQAQTPRSYVNSHHPSSLHQAHRDSSEEMLSPTLKPKAKKRKNPAPHDHSSATKASIGFNKTLLSQFDRWNQDERTENLFDFVLSDPPDIDVDDAEVEGLLDDEKHPSGQGDHQKLNVTPTSNAFRWYQEQQILAQELARQPKIAPLQLSDDESTVAQRNQRLQSGTTRMAGHTAQDEGQAHNGLVLEGELVLGEDPLAAFVPPRKKPNDTRKARDHHHNSNHHHNGGSSSSSHNHSQGLQDASNHSSGMPDSSPFLSAVQMLYSEDGPDDWNFQPFSMDSTDEYLNHDSPLQASSDYEQLNFQ